jgi:hypothetical protein
MRTSLILMAAVFVLAVSGCANVGESIIDGVFNSLLNDDEIHPRILKRRGIEPGSKQHEKMIREDQFYRDFNRNFGRKPWD